MTGQRQFEQVWGIVEGKTAVLHLRGSRQYIQANQRSASSTVAWLVVRGNKVLQTDKRRDGKSSVSACEFMRGVRG